MKWISVESGLPDPEEGIEYLIVDSNGVAWLCEFYYTWHGSIPTWINLGAECQPVHEEITHWQHIDPPELEK